MRQQQEKMYRGWAGEWAIKVKTIECRDLFSWCVFSSVSVMYSTLITSVLSDQNGEACILNWGL